MDVIGDSNFDSNTLFVDASANKVAIGHAAPDSNLHIVNNVSSGSIDNLSEYQILLYDGGSAASSYGIGIESSTLWYNTSDIHEWKRQGTTDLMTLNSTGLGINDTTPSYRLDVNGTFRATGAAIVDTLDTGQGANELYDMNQNVQTTDAVTFVTVNTGQGANELYDMNQNVQTTDAVTFVTVNTGQGANELYDMNQNVETTSNVTFGIVTAQNGASATGTARNGGIRFWTDNAFGSEIHYSNSSWQTAFYGRKSDTIALTLGAYDGSETAQQDFYHYMTIENSGEVGIGTENPAYALDVNGTFRATGAGLFSTTLTSTGILSVDDTTDSTSATTGSIQTDGGLGVAKGVYIGESLEVNGVMELGFQTVSDNVTLSGNSIAFVDTSSGNVTVTLPSASTVPGRQYTVKKTSVDNTLILSGSIDTYTSYDLSSGNTAFIKVMSNGTGWSIMGESAIGLDAGPFVLSSESFEDEAIGALTNVANGTDYVESSAFNYFINGNSPSGTGGPAVGSDPSGNCAMIRSSTGDMSLLNPMALSSGGYSSITISYAAKIDFIDGSHALFLDYSSNGAFTDTVVVKTFISTANSSGTPLEQYRWYADQSETLTDGVGGIVFSDTAKIRWRSGGWANSTHIFLDDIVITGNP